MFSLHAGVFYWFPCSSVGTSTGVKSKVDMHSHAGAWERDKNYP